MLFIPHTLFYFQIGLWRWSNRSSYLSCSFSVDCNTKIWKLEGRFAFLYLFSFFTIFNAFSFSQINITYITSIGAMASTHVSFLMFRFMHCEFSSHISFFVLQIFPFQITYFLNVQSIVSYFLFSLIDSRSIRIASAIPGLLIVGFLAVEFYPFFNIYFPFLLRILYHLSLLE